MITAEDAARLLESTQLLDKLIAHQYRLQERYGTWERIRDNPAARQQWMNQVFLAIFEETVEVMKETGYKNPELVPFGWKKTQVENQEKLKSEIIDLLHFWLVIAITAGFHSGAEIVAAYMAKKNINHQRQDQGY